MSKVLFVWYKKSKNILEGGGQCSRKNFDALQEIVGQGNVDSFYVHDEYQKKSLWDYVKAVFFFLFNYYYGLTPGRVAAFVRTAQQYDAVFIDRSIFGIMAKALKENGYQGRIITYFHNVEPVYFAAKVSKFVPGRSVLIRCVRVNEAYACRYSDKIVVLNQRDAQEVAQRYGRQADELIPIAFADKYIRAEYPTQQTSTRPLCIFLGTYFPPNNQGIMWFVRHVLPQVDIDMRVVGKGMARLKEEEPLLRDIPVVSDVPDLLPVFEEADVMILPIFTGSGMKVKTCESLMYGKNIIATPEAFEGYDVDYDKVGGCCKDAEAFVACIRQFASKPRPRFNSYSRQVFKEKYTLEAHMAAYRRLLMP